MESCKLKLRSLKYKIYSTLLFFILAVIFYTCKKRFNVANLANEASLFLFWHRKIAMQPFFVRKVLRPKHLAAVMTSEHQDGDLIKYLCQDYFNAFIIRGSAKRGGAKALLAMIKAARKGYDLLFAADGPRGPIYNLAPGIVYLAKKANMKVVILNFRANKFWQFKSWDKFCLPKPFSSIEFYASSALDLSNLDEEAAKQLLQERLMQYET